MLGTSPSYLPPPVPFLTALPPFFLYIKFYLRLRNWASQVAQWVKNPLAMPETQVQTLGQEDPLKEGVAVLSSVLAWRIPWTEEAGRLQSMGLQESDMT